MRPRLGALALLQDIDGGGPPDEPPGGEPPAAGGGPEAFWEPAADSVEELYRLCKL